MIPLFLKSNLEKIKRIKQPSFKIANRYFNYRHHKVIDGILHDCSDGYIGREQVTEYFKNHEYYKGFFAAMIWGGVSTGGVTGDNLSKLLDVTPERIDGIVLVVKRLLQQRLFSLAYDYMEREGKLKGLGDAYFTKLFFFISEADSLAIISPIFDKWTRLAYCALLIDEGDKQLAKQYISRVEGVDVKLRSAMRSAAFNDYVLRMNRWAKECDVEVNQLESFIFGTNRSKDKTSHNPRFYFESYVADRHAEVFDTLTSIPSRTRKEKVSQSLTTLKKGKSIMPRIVAVYLSPTNKTAYTSTNIDLLDANKPYGKEPLTLVQGGLGARGYRVFSGEDGAIVTGSHKAMRNDSSLKVLYLCGGVLVHNKSEAEQFTDSALLKVAKKLAQQLAKDRGFEKIGR
ncbi:hypothetical protein ACFFLZ_03085 [Photobacterium aphoticum]|uniref:8-oxoguanine DNA glycosylase OGG fold protein n=1 Tax=Photobacterium aphoticum TaxID=754436 RepID=UPI000B0E700F|nr:hypothetical protein [Photobacterium aphoticum]GHA51768.1 hypothetical protein GCM10007086_27060 [Photobacterium aphoticum]